MCGRIINEGRAHIVEPGLDELLNEVVGKGALLATTTVEPADIFVIAVPTPFKEGNRPDLRFVESATRMIAPVLTKGNVVILESTSPVGATEKVGDWLREMRPDLAIPEPGKQAGDVYLAYCPERILPGKVIEELVRNDRVIGGITPRCSEAAVAFYRHAVEGACHVTNARTAELCKLSENSFRDVNIAFANELSIVADKVGVDVRELIALANRHPRVNILNPGPGVGGHCIAVDPWFIVDSAPEEARLIRTAREVNDAKPHWVVEQVIAAAKAFEQPVVACMGLAYKPDVDDFRESPSVEVAHLLASHGGVEVIACEPFIDDLPASLRDQGIIFADADSAIDRANIVVFLTSHNQFRSLGPERLDGKVVFDTCGLLPSPTRT